MTLDAAADMRAWFSTDEAKAIVARSRARLEQLTAQVDPPVTSKCQCGAVSVAFDHGAAKALGADEVRSRWPRGVCPRCGIIYASAMHYIMGDW